MTVRSLLALAGVLSGGWSECGRDRPQDAPSPGPPAFCISPYPTAAGDAGRGPFVAHLKPSEVDGIFPPRWKKGDTWRIRYLLHPSGVENPVDEVSAENAYFLVASVPSNDRELYRIEVRKSRNQQENPFYSFTVRAQDFSVAGIDAVGIHVARGAHPFPNEPERAAVFPLVFPSVAPESLNWLFFELEPGVAGEAREGWQKVSPWKGEELGIELGSRSRHRYATFRVHLQWRRGDPWWSSARCWFAADPGMASTPSTEMLVCDAKLVRDGALAPTQ